VSVSAFRERGRTFVEALEYAAGIAVEYRSDPRAQLPEGKAHNRSPAAREFALALTALEDAQMRFTRGLAKLQGQFAPVDLEQLDYPAWKAEQQAASIEGQTTIDEALADGDGR
jgi:hypothetical protein